MPRTSSTSTYGPRPVHDRRVVMDPRDRAGLVRDRRAGREASGNGVVELLPLQDRDHRGVGARVDRLARARASRAEPSEPRAVVVLFSPLSNAF